MTVTDKHDRLCRYRKKIRTPSTCEGLKFRSDRIKRGESSEKAIINEHDTLYGYSENNPLPCTYLGLRTRDFFTNHKGTRHA